MKLKQSHVVFNEQAHTYHLKGNELQGITSTLIKAIFGDYTKDIPSDILERAKERGTYIHKEIERIDNGTSFATEPETMAYENLISAGGFAPIASEYIVTDGKHFASPIDKVYEHNGIYIADIKTTSKIHWAELRFQLSWYATYFQEMNKKAVEGAYVIWLPKEQYGECSMLSVELVSSEVIKGIVKAYLAGEDVTQYAKVFQKAYDLPVEVENTIHQLIIFEAQFKGLKEKMKQIETNRENFNKQLIEFMRATNQKKIEVGDVTLTLIDPTIRVSIDAKALKADHPDLYEAYKKESAVRENIRLTIKKQ